MVLALFVVILYMYVCVMAGAFFLAVLGVCGLLSICFPSVRRFLRGLVT